MAAPAPPLPPALAPAAAPVVSLAAHQATVAAGWLLGANVALSALLLHGDNFLLTLIAALGSPTLADIYSILSNTPVADFLSFLHALGYGGSAAATAAAHAERVSFFLAHALTRGIRASQRAIAEAAAGPPPAAAPAAPAPLDPASVLASLSGALAASQGGGTGARGAAFLASALARALP